MTDAQTPDKSVSLHQDVSVTDVISSSPELEAKRHAHQAGHFHLAALERKTLPKGSSHILANTPGQCFAFAFRPEIKVRSGKESMEIVLTEDACLYRSDSSSSWSLANPVCAEMNGEIQRVDGKWIRFDRAPVFLPLETAFSAPVPVEQSSIAA